MLQIPLPGAPIVIVFCTGEIQGVKIVRSNFDVVL
jgi:hypothetical protein